jgi:SAM-dependent methyltransferase
MVAPAAESMLQEWLDEYGDLFKPTEPKHALIPWLTFRVESTFRPGGTVVDLGGGLDLGNGVLAQLGMNTYVVDLLENYFPHSTLKTDAQREVQFLESKGVRYVRADLTSYDLRENFQPDSVDVVCSYHALEHLHHSPRAMLDSAMAVLKPGGLVFFEVPNATNALKRIRVLLGRTNYQPYQQYWDSDVWVGHVREYTVGDLQALAKHLHLANWEILGRNWYGALYSSVSQRRIASSIDRVLRNLPGLCGSLFLKGNKPA